MKTPIAIILLLLFFCCISATVTKAQEPDTFKYHSGEEDSIIYLSKHTVLLEAKATVRFSTTSRVYLKWTAPPVMSTGYSVKYKLLGASSWTTVSNSTLEIVITSLQLDTTYLLEILPTGMTDLSAYKFNGMFSTRPQSEPLEVSHKLFQPINGLVCR